MGFNIHHDVSFDLKKHYMGGSNNLYLGNNDFSNVYIGDYRSNRRIRKILHQNDLRDMNLGKINLVKAKNSSSLYKPFVQSSLKNYNSYSNNMKLINKNSQHLRDLNEKKVF